MRVVALMRARGSKPVNGVENFAKMASPLMRRRESKHKHKSVRQNVPGHPSCRGVDRNSTFTLEIDVTFMSPLRATDNLLISGIKPGSEFLADFSALGV